MFYGLKKIPFIPDRQVNDARLPFDQNTLHKWSIMASIDFVHYFGFFLKKICSCFVIILNQKDSEFSKSSI